MTGRSGLACGAGLRNLGGVVLFCCAACSPAGESSTPSAENLSINELSGAGTEWLELYHSGSGELDLGHYGLTDTDKTTGLPRVDKAMRFPSDTRLAPRGFLLALLGKSNAAPGPYTADACLPNIESGCFFATFSISEARGEAIYLVTPDNEVLLSMNFPADLAAPAGSNSTVCRLPDGTGDLTTCAPTPGASNAAP